MTASEENKVQQALEIAIDNSSLRRVLEMIEEICHDKASHIEENWQDHQLAAEWAVAGLKVSQLTENELIKTL